MTALDDAMHGHAHDDARGALVPVRRLLALAGVAAVLAVVAALTALPKLAPPAPTQIGERVFDLEPRRVRSIDMALPPEKGGLFKFVRRDATWTLYRRDGISAEVPADRLDDFLAAVAGLTRLVEIEGADIDGKDFGFDPPRAVVTIRDGGARAFAIGDRNPPLTALYVQVLPSPTIVLVGSVLLWELDKLIALTKTLPVEQRERTDAAEMR
jgi:hypothetical protein